MEVESKNTKITVPRQIAYQPDEGLSVSCDPTGKRVSVSSFNLKFRDNADKFTDRGIVWVLPGKLTTLMLVVVAKALNQPGLITEIINKATEAVEQKLLSRFQAIKA